jgi:transcriptional regulator with XRE-family HTH domain
MGKMPSIREIAAHNLGELMAKDDSARTLEKLALKSGVGKSTIDRMKKGQVGVSLDTLEAVAQVFKIEAWQLIHPHMGNDSFENELLTMLKGVDADGRRSLVRIALGLSKTNDTTGSFKGK